MDGIPADMFVTYGVQGQMRRQRQKRVERQLNDSKVKNRVCDSIKVARIFPLTLKCLLNQKLETNYQLLNETMIDDSVSLERAAPLLRLGCWNRAYQPTGRPKCPSCR